MCSKSNLERDISIVQGSQKQIALKVSDDTGEIEPGVLEHRRYSTPLAHGRSNFFSNSSFLRNIAKLCAFFVLPIIKDLLVDVLLPVHALFLDILYLIKYDIIKRKRKRLRRQHECLCFKHEALADFSELSYNIL